MIRNRIALIAASFLLLTSLGCNSQTGPILPKGELTEEQKQKIKAEDRAIENEESQGSVKN